jgi:uncharacterized protein YbjT (DUF2867 family)
VEVVGDQRQLRVVVAVEHLAERPARDLPGRADSRAGVGSEGDQGSPAVLGVGLPYDEADLAAVAAAVLADPALGGRAYTLTGPRSLTFTNQIGILSRVTGRDIAVKHITRQEWKADMAEYIDGPVGDALLDYWRSCDGRPAELTSVVEELTGRPARTFASWAEEHRAAFLG